MACTLFLLTKVPLHGTEIVQTMKRRSFCSNLSLDALCFFKITMEGHGGVKRRGVGNEI